MEKQQQLQAVYPQVREELMRIPGVVKVGIGIKEKAGKLIDESVFRVYVMEKKPLDALSLAERIPTEIHGIKTDVVIVRPNYPEAEDPDRCPATPKDPDEYPKDTDKYRPVKGGVQIQREGKEGKGTLGCLARLVSDNSAVLLSAAHVIYSDSATDNTEIGQPWHGNSCCCTCNAIAVNLVASPRSDVDCAIARLKPDVEYEARIKEIGFITGVQNAVHGEEVKKRGRSTGLTFGHITDLTFTADGTISEIEVKKNNGCERFSLPGDSGSALLNARNEIIGLHVEGNNREDVTPGDFESTSIGINRVLRALKAEGLEITIITGAGGDESAESRLARPAGLSDALWAFELRLQETEAGRELWEAVSRHQYEALSLVNEVRPVTVTWHRNKGPVFLAALGRSAKEPAYRIPAEIEGVSRQEAITNIMAALTAHGSEALCTDLGLFAPLLIDAFVQSNSIEEMICYYESATIRTAAQTI
jgi:hypothetical protein